MYHSVQTASRIVLPVLAVAMIRKKSYMKVDNARPPPLQVHSRNS